MARDLAHALSVLAALESAAGREGYVELLPFLGMARAELTDFGQAPMHHYVDVPVVDVGNTLTELEECLVSLLAESQVLQHTLRLEAGLRWLRRGPAQTAFCHPLAYGHYRQPCR